MGERIYHLMAETDEVRQNWVTSLESSILTAKEISKGDVFNLMIIKIIIKLKAKINKNCKKY